MPFVHITLLPFITVIFLIYLHNLLSEKEFIQYLKIFACGLLIGLVINIIFAIINYIFLYSAHHLTIFLKSLFFDGLLFSVIVCVTIYLIYNNIVDIKLTSNWAISSIMSFSYISGIYTVTNIAETLSKKYPDTLLMYFSIIPFIIFISLILGLGTQNYFDSYLLLNKILWSAFTISSLTASLMIYNYLRFYNYNEHYFVIIIFTILFIVFEIREFSYFRKR